MTHRGAEMDDDPRTADREQTEGHQGAAQTGRVGSNSPPPKKDGPEQAAVEADPTGIWSKPRPEKLPSPTYAPATMALGIVLLLWGMLTTPLISLVGLVLFVIALAGWIGDLRHER
ncbi:MAG: hypothetical protein ACRD18_08465 [Terriglobia bacterium]